MLTGAWPMKRCQERARQRRRSLGQSRCLRFTGSGGIIRLPRAAGSRELQRTVREYRRARRGFDDAAVARIGPQGDGDNSKLMI